MQACGIKKTSRRQDKRQAGRIDLNKTNEGSQKNQWKHHKPIVIRGKVRDKTLPNQSEEGS